MSVKLARLIHCAECGRNKLHEAKGLCGYCYHRQYREAHREERLELQRQWCKANPDKKREASRRYYRANADKVQKYYTDHLEERRKYYHQWYEANRKKVIDTSRRWQRANPGKRRESVRRWAVANPDKVREKSRCHRALKKGAAISDFTTEDWQAVMNHYGNKCAYCGATDSVLERDHIIPLSRGGHHTISNIAPACRSCNSKKGTRTPAEAKMYLWQLPLTRRWMIKICSQLEHSSSQKEKPNLKKGGD